MNTETTLIQAFEMAEERYASLGVDVKKAMNALLDIPLSLHCWQADDVTGFETLGGKLSGGIQVTGNYPGKARNMDEVRADLRKAAAFLPGKHRLSLHAIYADYGGNRIDRDAIGPEHFASWMEWARDNGMKLDFNSTSFSHPLSGSLTLSHPDPAIRHFWIEHHKRCREISDAIGRFQNDPCVMNLWIHDGSKEVPASRLHYRQLLETSLDEIFSVPLRHTLDTLEAKLFGIGLESYTVGSYDFYMGYALRKGKMLTLDTGHFHPTESVADKLSALLLFSPGVMLHVSRPVRWDSDHVVVLNDDLTDLAREIVRCDALDRVHIGLDYFDATIHRIGAYATGARAAQKALLLALLEPVPLLRQYEADGRLFERLALQEEMKAMPWGAVWDYLCLTNDVPTDEACIGEIQLYEKTVTAKRV